MPGPQMSLYDRLISVKKQYCANNEVRQQQKYIQEAEKCSAMPKINEKSRQMLREKHTFYGQVKVEDRLHEYKVIADRRKEEQKTQLF